MTPGRLAWFCGFAILATAAVQAQGTTRVSVDAAGLEVADGGTVPRLSADGRYVVFQSESETLVPGDTNGTRDIFVHDRHTGVVVRASVNSAGVQGNSLSSWPTISANGRYVAFDSYSSNLVPGDTNLRRDVFVRDLVSGTTVRASVDSNGVQGDDDSDSPWISADGRYVAFCSVAENLDPADNTPISDVFLHDLQTGTTELVNVDSSGIQANHSSLAPMPSADGRYVIFTSRASNLVAGDANGAEDVFVRDRLLGITERVSVDSFGAEGDWDSGVGRFSPNGRYVVFPSLASNLVPGDTNGFLDVFVRDLVTGVTERVSVDSTGVEGNLSSVGSSISADGRFVVFHSVATNLVPGDANGEDDVFLHDRRTGETRLVSVSSSGAQTDDGSALEWISADGRTIAFQSLASNLVPNDTNGWFDVFVHGGPRLAATGVCPGPMTWTVRRATPGGQVVFAWGTPGGFALPAAKPCGGLTLDLVPLLRPRGGFVVVRADSQGAASFVADVKPAACGAILVQALDLDACAKSNAVVP